MVTSCITLATLSLGWTVVRPFDTTPFTVRVDTVLVFVEERVQTDITCVLSPYGIATELESILRFWEMENKKFKVTSKKEDATVVINSDVLDERSVASCYNEYDDTDSAITHSTITLNSEKCWRGDVRPFDMLRTSDFRTARSAMVVLCVMLGVIAVFYHALNTDVHASRKSRTLVCVALMALFVIAYDYVYLAATCHPIDTVILHEIGHALGFGHSDSKRSIMSASLHQAERCLTSDDTNGTLNLYGAVPVVGTHECDVFTTSHTMWQLWGIPLAFVSVLSI